MEGGKYTISEGQSESIRVLRLGLTLCVRILFRELDRSGDRLLSFLREFVAHRRRVVVVLDLKWVCGMGENEPRKLIYSSWRGSGVFGARPPPNNWAAHAPARCMMRS
jgi:hypothetical protein